MSVLALLELTVTGLVATAFCALASSGLPGRPVVFLTLAGLLVRALSACGVRMPKFNARHANIAALAYVAFLPVDYYLISKDPLVTAVHGIAFLSVVRVLTAHNGREYFFAGAISFVELIAASFLSPAGTFSAWLIPYIAFAIAAMTCAQLSRSATAPGLARRVLALTTLATTGVIVMTAALFFAMPRTGRASSRFLRGDRRSTGFTSVVDLGGFGGVAKDDTPVMHVRAYGKAATLDWSGVKWRGAALSRFDGHRWSEPTALPVEIPSSPGPAAVADVRQLSRRDGERILYSVEIPEAGSGTLFFAGIPEFISIESRVLLMNRTGMLRVPAAPGDTLRYQVSAFAGQRRDAPLSDADRIRSLRLPPIDPRITTLAREWAGVGADADRAIRIRNHLQSDFKYVLDGPAHPVADPLADFLFVRREGYCEYFASSMAVMLRSIDIPARVVTGFTGGFRNRVTGSQVLRASDAHAWVEAFLAPAPGADPAWTTFDPTPLAAQTSNGGSSALGMYIEALSSLWHEWVVAYDLPHQALAAAQVRSAFRKRMTLPSLTGMLIGLLGLIAAAWGIRRAMPTLRALSFRRRIRRLSQDAMRTSEAAALYAAMAKKLARRGFVRRDSETPQEFARRLPPTEAQFALRFTDLYQRMRYGFDSGAAQALSTLLDEQN